MRTVQARLPAPSMAIRGLDGVTFISMPVLGRGAARVAIGSRPPSVPGPSVTAPVAGSTVRSSIQRIWSTRWCSRHAGAEHQTTCTRSPSRTARGAMFTACRPDSRTLAPKRPP